MAENKQESQAEETQKPQESSGVMQILDNLPKIFDFTQLTQEKGGDKENKVYNYFWRVFDFRGGKTINDMIDSHPYSKDPRGNLSKSPHITSLTFLSML